MRKRKGEKEDRGDRVHGGGELGTAQWGKCTSAHFQLGEWDTNDVVFSHLLSGGANWQEEEYALFTSPQYCGIKFSLIFPPSQTTQNFTPSVQHNRRPPPFSFWGLLSHRIGCPNAK